MGNLERLQKTARQLLTEGKVELVIGYERGTLPLHTTPCFIRDPSQAERLVWNQSCSINLAKYLHQTSGKVGIVAKGCDARAIVSEVVERQIAREDVVVIGVPCQGVIDQRKLAARLDGRKVLKADFSDGLVRLRGEGFEESPEITGLLCDECATCQHRNPSLYDVLVGELGEDEGNAGQDANVTALEAQTAEERWAYFTNEFSRCIRCYACRQVCPACYCPECFVDETQPSWFGKGNDLSDVIAFHLVRAYHLAGRCVDCGACSRACPMHIDLRTLRNKLQKDVRELYGHEAGMDLEALPPLATFRPDDPQGFVK